MKKTILILATIFGFGIAGASAQTNSNDIQLGVRGGVNFANIASNEDIGSYDSRTNFYAGLVAELPLQERFSLQGEVFYSGQGFEQKMELMNQEYKYKYKADYIQVPLLAKFYIVEGLSVSAGPQFGFKVNEKISLSDSSSSLENDASSLKTFDFQGTGGLEYKFDNGLAIQGRYTYGFSDLVKDNNIHTSVFSVGLGYMF